MLVPCCAADVAKRVVCASVLDDSQAAIFKKAVKKHYWYELFMDELPVWGFVGLPPEEAKDDQHIYIYTHKSLDISYNGDRVRLTGILKPIASWRPASCEASCMSCVSAKRDCRDLHSLCCMCIPWTYVTGSNLEHLFPELRSVGRAEGFSHRSSDASTRFDEQIGQMKYKI